MWEGTGIGDPLIYWALRIILLCSLVFCGWGISYGKSQDYKKYSFIAVVFYSLIIGLRWMRGADYYHYYNDIVTLFGQYAGLYGRGTITLEPEFLYDCWVTLFYYSGLPFWFAFVFYSAFLISSFLLVLKHFKKIAIWALPLFFILTQTQAENLVRQYIAIAFLLLSYNFYLEGKNYKMIFSLLTILLIHFSGLFIVVLFLFITYLKNVLDKLHNKIWLCILLSIFIYTYFFWDVSYLTHLAEFIEKNISFGGEKGAIYTDNAERWFTNEGSISQIVNGTNLNVVSSLFLIIRFMTYFSIIYLGYFVSNYDKRFYLPFYFSYFAIMMKNLGGDIEMFQRFYDWFIVLMPVLIGAYMSYLKINKTIKLGLYSLYLLNFLWYSFLGSMLVTSLFGYGFIWDANVELW